MKMNELDRYVGIPVRSPFIREIWIKPNARLKKARRKTPLGLWEVGKAVVNGEEVTVFYNIYQKPLRVRVYIRNLEGYWIVDDEDVEVEEGKP